MSKVAIGPFHQIVTMRNLNLKGPVTDADLEIITYGGLIVKQGQIKLIDRFEKIRQTQKTEKLPLIEIQGKQIALPGFIDSHTHIAFGGSRVKDFAMRLEGKTYLEIAKEGGGIWDTVNATRKLTKEELTQRIVERAEKCLADGVTTIEVKSGYGLSIEEEIKILRSIEGANQVCDSDLIPTCLAAHIRPKDFQGNHKDYLDFLIDQLFPWLMRERLANRADIYIDKGAFAVAEADQFCKQVRKMGFDLTIHADQFSTGGSALAVTHNALSADHLESSGESDIKRLAASDTVATVLPGASLGLGMNFAPARKLLDAGACLAIASDWNPGSAPMGDLVTASGVLAAYEKLSIGEVLSGITFRAATALGLNDRGVIDVDKMADLVVYRTEDFRNIIYYQGQLKPTAAVKSGMYIDTSKLQNVL